MDYPLHPHISMHILYKVLYMLPTVLTERVSLIIRRLVIISFILITLV